MRKIIVVAVWHLSERGPAIGGASVNSKSSFNRLMSITNKTTTTTMRAWAACLTLAALFVAASADEKALTVEFDVRPGGIVHSFRQELGKFGCTFTYAAQGGTNEQWLMSLGSNEDQSLFSCSVWRPNGKSYLFFVQFNTEISGAKVEFAEAFSQAATINLKDIALKPSEIVVGEHTVSHNPGQFGSQLSKLMIVSRKPHEEL